MIRPSQPSKQRVKSGRHRLNKAWVQTLGFGAFWGVASFSRHIPTRAGETRLAAPIARVPRIPGIKDALTAIPFSFTPAQTKPRAISPCDHSNGDLHPPDKPRTVSNPPVSPLCSTPFDNGAFLKTCSRSFFRRPHDKYLFHLFRDCPQI
jgi:hypothetical protein